MEQEHKKEEEANKNNDLDIFEWLELKTRHDALHKKLRSVIMEKMNDYENQVKLIER